MYKEIKIVDLPRYLERKGEERERDRYELGNETRVGCVVGKSSRGFATEKERRIEWKKKMKGKRI